MKAKHLHLFLFFASGKSKKTLRTPFSLTALSVNSCEEISMLKNKNIETPRRKKVTLVTRIKK
jgi:hypothetical protein